MSESKSNVSPGKAEKETPKTKVKVGVAWRRDGQGTAHAGDLLVFGHPALANEVEVFSLVWHGAPHNLHPSKIADLGAVDLLVVPGGPHANATQIPVVGQGQDNVPSPGGTANYANRRAQSELDLIERARTLGMPILALCGGSWRLLQNYGGQTVELAALDGSGQFRQQGSTPQNRQRHAGNMNNVSTEFKHGTDVQPGSMLGRAMAQGFKRGQAVPQVTSLQVNSVHWAVYRTRPMGTRNGLQAMPFGLVPNDQLTMTARDSGSLATPEAIESQSGAPVIGVQWHPEYQLPVNGGQQEASRAANLNLLRWMIAAGRAYRAHRNAMQQLLGRAPDTAPTIQFRGAPVHTGGLGQGPSATVIPQHADDTATRPDTKAEQAVRRYLFSLGRNGKDKPTFLLPMEVFNLATGQPLVRLHDPDVLRKQPVITFMNSNVWAQRYCSGESKNIIMNWG